MSSTSTGIATPQGPGSVTGAPDLPAGFAGTFASHFVDTDGLRQHVVIGGDGPPLLLVHGWPQTWYYWRLVMPALAREFQVIAPDQRGIGLTAKPEDGYDTGALAGDLAALLDALGHERFAVVGVDTGMAIAYALAADHPGRVVRLAVGEAPLPGVSPPTPLILPPQVVDRLWHIPFNQLWRRTRSSSAAGRTSSSAPSSPPRPARTSCRRPPSGTTSRCCPAPRPCTAASSSTAHSRATAAQNEQRKARRLTMPVLAMGGAESSASMPAETMKLAADDVEALVIPGIGHWLAEQAPDEILTALTTFLAPYRDGHAAEHASQTAAVR